ncbi:MAG: hypothetical protein ACFFE4_02010 [Candidatus Thorarchaeota archaeon]
MKIFDWVEEIENIYKNLIDKSKEENLTELENLRSEQEKYMEEKIDTNHKIVNSALNSLIKKLDDKNTFITEKLKEFKTKMAEQYLNSKEELFKLLIKDIGFDF